MIKQPMTYESFNVENTYFIFCFSKNEKENLKINLLKE